jgi:uncharacterized lipoprotein YddW (UPF0748 family)
MQHLAEANFNSVFTVVDSWDLAVAHYQRAGKCAGWDCLGYLVQAAEKNSLQVHFWYTPIAGKPLESPEFDVKFGGNPDWRSKRLSKDGTSMVFGGDVCPLHPEARRWQLDLISSALKRYPTVRGVHIEEPGYGDQYSCMCGVCSRLYALVLGSDQVPAFRSTEVQDIKSLGTTALMQALRTMMLEEKPDSLLSANGGCSWQIDRLVGRDWTKWANLGWLDLYFPQIYTRDVSVFEQKLGQVQASLKGRCPVVPIIGLRWGEHHTNDIDIVLRQIEVARKSGAAGVAFYPASEITAEYLAALCQGPFKEKVGVPSFRQH